MKNEIWEHERKRCLIHNGMETEIEKKALKEIKRERKSLLWIITETLLKWKIIIKRNTKPKVIQMTFFTRI